MRTYHTVDEEAGRVRLPVATFRLYIRQGKVSAMKVGKRYLLDPDRVDRDLEKIARA